jgi:hypothetical protein
MGSRNKTLGGRELILCVTTPLKVEAGVWLSAFRILSATCNRV